MAQLKEALKADLVKAMKVRDERAKATIRMALSAIGTEEVSGKQARNLSEAEEIAVLTREVSKRKDAASAYEQGNRHEQAQRELAEAELLLTYLPAPLSDDDLKEIVAAVIAGVAADLGAKPSMKQMGQIMKVVNEKVKGRADGAQTAALVRSALS